MAKKKTLQDFGFPADYEPAAAGLLDAIAADAEECILTEDDRLVPKEIGQTESVIKHEVVTAPTFQIKHTPFIATWDQIKNQLGSVSAMKSELTGVRITHGDAIAIFKTDAHRKLYEEWAAFKRQKG